MSTIFRARHLACTLGALLLSGVACSTQLVALTEDLPPLNYKEDGIVTGYSTELLKAMASESGHELSVTMLPWPRAYRTTLAHRNIILYSLVRTEEREPLFAWIGPISPRKIFLFRLRQRKDVHVATLADARKYRIGAVYEMAATKALVRRGFSFQAELDGAPNDESNVRKLFAGRVDLILALDWSAYFYAKKYGHKPADLVPEILVDDSHAYYFGMRKDSDPAIVGRLTDALEKARADGLTDRLRKKYMGR